MRVGGNEHHGSPRGPPQLSSCPSIGRLSRDPSRYFPLFPFFPPLLSFLFRQPHYYMLRDLLRLGPPACRLSLELLLLTTIRGVCLNRDARGHFFFLDTRITDKGFYSFFLYRQQGSSTGLAQTAPLHCSALRGLLSWKRRLFLTCVCEGQSSHTYTYLNNRIRMRM